MKELLKNLSLKMAAVETGKDLLKKKKDEFETQNKGLIDSIKQHESDVAELKEQIIPFALQEFSETGNKKVTGGIGIQVKKSQKVVYDSGKAMDFAKDKDMFLTLDVKAFENAAPSLNLDFVSIEDVETKKVTFPKVIKLEDDSE